MVQLAPALRGEQVTIRIPLTRGRTALVDVDDYPLISNRSWQYGNNGYVTSGGRIYMHRLIMNAPKGALVDHINRDRLDNRRTNLRFATAQQQSVNSNPRPARVPYKGVSLHYGKYAARITVNGELRLLGSHDTAEAAARAYDEVALAEWGEFARLNFADGAA